MDKTVTGIIKPGQIINPGIDEKDIPGLVTKCYGLKTHSVKQLNGYDDKNYFIKVLPQLDNPYISEISQTGYVLKVMNSEDSKQDDVIIGQHMLMEYISNSELGFSVPSLIKNLNGELFSLEVFENFKENENELNSEDKANPIQLKHVVRMLKFIPGKLMKEVEYTKHLLFEVGKLTGKLYSILKNFKNQALENRKNIWQLGSIQLLSDFLYAVKEEEKRKVFKEILGAYEKTVQPAIESLEKGIVHGDLNEQNLLVSSDGNVEALLDFGDVNFSPFVFELAIAISYVLLEVTTIDPNESGGYVIAGYETERKVTQEEWNVLKECVGGRITQSLVLGAYSYLYNPGNDYVLCTAKEGWERLLKFWSVPKEDLISKWKAVSSLCMASEK